MTLPTDSVTPAAGVAAEAHAPAFVRFRDRVRAAGGCVVVQDAATSIVYGMPQAARERAGADLEAPLGGIAAAIAEGLRRVGCDLGDAPVAGRGIRELSPEAPRLRSRPIPT